MMISPPTGSRKDDRDGTGHEENEYEGIREETEKANQRSEARFPHQTVRAIETQPLPRCFGGQPGRGSLQLVQEIRQWAVPEAIEGCLSLCHVSASVDSRLSGTAPTSSRESRACRRRAENIAFVLSQTIAQKLLNLTARIAARRSRRLRRRMLRGSFSTLRITCSAVVFAAGNTSPLPWFLDALRQRFRKAHPHLRSAPWLVRPRTTHGTHPP